MKKQCNLEFAVRKYKKHKYGVKIMIDYKELLQQRRSVRDYEDKKVPNDILQEILQDTCIAPSACNRQPWKFVVVQDKKLMQRISAESKKNLLNEALKDPMSHLQRFKERFEDPNYNVFYNAPCLVMIVGEKNNHWFVHDCTLAACYFMFAATARKLGTCWIGLGADIRDPELRAELGLAPEHEIIAPLILGYPKKILSNITRKEPEILHWAGKQQDI